MNTIHSLRKSKMRKKQNYKKPVMLLPLLPLLLTACSTVSQTQTLKQLPEKAWLQQTEISVKKEDLKTNKSVKQAVVPTLIKDIKACNLDKQKTLDWYNGVKQ